MFDELIRELRRLEGGCRVHVSVSSDSDGYIDRECPSAECLFKFKVHEDDWRVKVRDEEVFCPFCGHTAGSGSWMSPEQAEHVEESAFAQINQHLGCAMKRDAERWNRRQPRDSFVRITMNVDSRPRHVALPPAAAAPMRLKIACPECACRYAVVGAAFFCPACGHNAAEQMFSLSLAGIRRALDALPEIQASIPDRDTAETMVRLLVENGLQNAVTAFQRYAEAVYARFPAKPKVRRNAFQNLAKGDELWRAATGRGYLDYLDEIELATLRRAFQQRHLLAHTQGFVDDDYLIHSGDTAYRLGQRLVLREGTVRECLDLTEKLASGMAADVPEVS